jgi:hypothetical protein
MSRIVLIFVSAFALSETILGSTAHLKSKCGVELAVPPGWHAILEKPKDQSDFVLCEIAIQPVRWPAIVAKSRWDAPDHPLLVFVFAPSTSYEQALDDVGFEKDEFGRGLGFETWHGQFETAEPFSAGGIIGVLAQTVFRGYIRDQSLRRPEEPGVFTGGIDHIVLKTAAGRFIGFECAGATPDAPIDCRQVIQLVAGSLRFVTRPAPPN